MPNFKEAAVAGTKWQRCRAVHIANELGTVPVITYASEAVASVGEDTFKTAIDEQLHVLFDPNELVDLVDPTTLEPLGVQVSVQELYVGIFSHYIKHAQLAAAPA